MQILTLNNEKEQLYQYDTGITATVNIECAEVHFSNLNYGKALVCEVKDGIVSIPDELLRTGAELKAWAVVIDEYGKNTEKSQIFAVEKRPKPNDYVSKTYQDGYADGYADGEEVSFDKGYTEGYTQGETAGYNNGYSAGETAGYNNGYSKGETAGYNNGLDVGIEQGEAETLAKLEPLTVTENGTYIPEVGYNEVTVSVVSEKFKQIVEKTITEVTAEDLAGVEMIGDYAFYKITSLASVTIPDSVTSIGYEAFRDCESLADVAIGDSVTTIDSSAFRECTSLTTVTIPDSVTTIGSFVFYGTAIYNDDSNWVDGVLYIDNCLIGAKRDILPSNYTIKDGTRLISGSAFSDCTSLTSVTIPESVTTIGDYAFSDCSSLASVTIPESVTTIGDYAFSDCGSLASITIPDSAVTLGESIFKYCIKATSVKIGDSITILPYETFCYCRSLEQVTIPSAVITIGGDAFWGCKSLADAIIEGDVLKNLDNSAVFHQTPIEAGTGFIYIKPTSPDVNEATLVEEYKNATNWSVYADQIKGYSEYTEEE